MRARQSVLGSMRHGTAFVLVRGARCLRERGAAPGARLRGGAGAISSLQSSHARAVVGLSEGAELHTGHPDGLDVGLAAFSWLRKLDGVATSWRGEKLAFTVMLSFVLFERSPSLACAGILRFARLRMEDAAPLR